MTFRSVFAVWADECRSTRRAVFVTLAAIVGCVGQAAAETVDYVTPIGNCNVKLDEEGNDRSLTLQPGETRFELWAHWIDMVSSREVIVDDDDAGTVSLTIGRKRGGVENATRGCESKGSVEVTVNAPVNRPADLRRTLRLRSNDRTFDQPVNVIRLPAFTLTWDPADAVATCLTKAPAGSAQFLNNNKRLEIRLPPGHAADQTNCTDSLRLRSSFAAYSVNVESKATQFSQSHAVTVVQKPAPMPVGPVTTGPKMGLNSGANLQVNQPAYVTLSPPPVLYSVRANSLSVGDLLPFRENAPILDLLPLEIRKLPRETVLTIGIANPDGRSDAVELAIFPTAANGFSAAMVCPTTPVIAGNLVTGRVTFAQPTAANTSLVYRMTTASCFAGEAGQVPYTASPSDPNGIQPAIAINQGSSFLDLNFRTVNAAGCAGETPVTHRMEAAFSTADMLNQTPGRYTTCTISMRRVQ